MTGVPAAGPAPVGDAAAAGALAAWSLAIRAATPALALRLWLRARREPGYGEHWSERWALGRAPAAAPAGVVWLHAVSLGETHACLPLLEAIAAARPGARFLLTHMTATGREAGAQLAARPALAGRVTQAWLPYDTPGAVRRFLAAHRPALGLLMETELWPNLVAGCRAAGVPLALVNARLSERSLRRGLRMRALIGPALRGLAGVIAQTPADAQRLRRLGRDDVLVAGNLKFDRAPDDALRARGLGWRDALRGRAVVLAASTRDGEEDDLLSAWSAVASVPAGNGKGEALRPLLAIVPRHPQRFDEVAARIAVRGLRCVRRSAGDDAASRAAWADAEVLLGDSMGEMPAWYAFADVAILGGSLRPFGGQNLIEAAAVGCPVVTGPHTFNFAQAAEDAVAEGAACRVGDAAAAIAEAAAITDDGVRRSRMSGAAEAWIGAHRGATARTLAALGAWLPPTAGARSARAGQA